MVERIKWIDRKFDFNQPLELFPVTLERLRGTHARLVAMLQPLPYDALLIKYPGVWSIQEHVGHLIDLEELHEGRIDDFLANRKMLRPADMTNGKTNYAEHNDNDIEDMLEDFYNVREHFIKRLEELEDEILARAILHPRLNQLMRPVDMAIFIAEHDDHHLAIIRELINEGLA